MKRVLRWALITLGRIVGLAVVAACALYAMSARKLGAKHDAAVESALVIPTDSASIARGAHLVRARPCGQCHGADLGGSVFADAGPFALLAAPNLTRGRGGLTPRRSDAEWERAIRHGIRRDGTSLVVMPSEVFNAITDDEMAAMIAYLKQVSPVDREVPPTTVRIVGRMLLGAGQFKTAADMSPRTAHVASVDTTPGVEYGRYLVTVSGCRMCHGDSYSGGPGFGPNGKPPSNITPTGIGHYTEDDFKRALRTGDRPKGGGVLSGEMPWKYFGTMSDGELQSIWLFLKTLPPKQFAER
jgi:mono/diheme cytochrome c family protein